MKIKDAINMASGTFVSLLGLGSLSGALIIMSKIPQLPFKDLYLQDRTLNMLGLYLLTSIISFCSVMLIKSGLELLIIGYKDWKNIYWNCDNIFDFEKEDFE